MKARSDRKVLRYDTHAAKHHNGTPCTCCGRNCAPQVNLASNGYYMVDGSVVMKSGVFLQGG